MHFRIRVCLYSVLTALFASVSAALIIAALVSNDARVVWPRLRLGAMFAVGAAIAVYAILDALRHPDLSQPQHGPN